MPQPPRLVADDRGGLVELAERLDSLVTTQWRTRQIEVRNLGRIARLADNVHDLATRLLRHAPLSATSITSRVLTGTEHTTLTARLETLLEHVDLLADADPVRHWAVVIDIEIAAQDLVWYLRRVRHEAV
jgi:hypothetical protein